MFEISIQGHFSSAHRLVGYEGKCAVPHGHNWHVEVFVRGEGLDERGILVDFRELKTAVGEELAELDHADLNALAAFTDMNPTSENIARYLFERLSSALDKPECRVSRVEVSETPGSKAAYWAPDSQ